MSPGERENVVMLADLGPEVTMELQVQEFPRRTDGQEQPGHQGHGDGHEEREQEHGHHGHQERQAEGREEYGHGSQVAELPVEQRADRHDEGVHEQQAELRALVGRAADAHEAYEEQGKVGELVAYRPDTVVRMSTIHQG